MAQADLSKMFDSLDATAAQLNEASNSLNTIVNAVEKRLAAANLGLQVWLEHEPLTETHVKCPGGRERFRIDAVTIEERLGYARLDGGPVSAHSPKWCLAVKRIRIVVGFDYEEQDSYRSEQQETAPIPLAQASRQARIAAIPLFPRLIEELEENAHGALNKIKRATSLWV